MTPSEPSARVADLVAALDLDEKARLTAGDGFWRTHAIARVGLPAVQLTDGPNGARGPVLRGEGGPRSVCVPCGTALGASWDVELLGRIGSLLGTETRRKACRVLLAPTVNIHRSPLAGRDFECYSEDPLLSGALAAAFIRGAQAHGVATTVKHLVGNEAEFQRTSMSSEIDERTLREIYLVPFERAVRDGGSLGVMTSYNRLNGRWCTEDVGLLRDILRGEWGFEGFVVTDWYGVADTAVSPVAGVDLEMPGPARSYGPALADAVRSGEVDEADLDAAVTRVLTVMDRIGALDDTGGAEAFGVDEPAERALAAEAAAAGMVLLTNDGTLPLELAPGARVAVIGPNAAKAVIMGGGSSHVQPTHLTSPLDALIAHLTAAPPTPPQSTPLSELGVDAAAGATDSAPSSDGGSPSSVASGELGADVVVGATDSAPSSDGVEGGIEVVFEPGVDITRSSPPLTGPIEVEMFAGPDWAGDPIRTETWSTLRFLAFGPPKGLPAELSLRATATLVPTETARHRFTLAQAGGARLTVGGEVLIDGIADPIPPGRSFMGFGSKEVAADVDLVEGEAVSVVVELTSGPGAGPSAIHGVEVGARALLPDDALDRAVAAAADAEVAIVVVGTDDEWESEGFDRRSMDLPGAQDELIRQVAAANPRTVVVVNAGAPVTMDWVDEPAAVLQVWFGGQEMGPALAEVLTGEREPGGRLPTTIPLRLEHNPSFGNFPGDHDVVCYGEGVLVGYRWYDTRRLPVRFPFGHGLGYTAFEIGEPTLSADALRSGASDTVTVTVSVTNVGDRAGSEVIQLYVAPPAHTAVPRPAQELRAFAKVHLAAGESTEVELTLDDRAFSFWDVGTHGHAEIAARLPLGGGGGGRGGGGERAAGWRADPGRHELRIGRSSADIAHVTPLDVT